MGLKVCEKFILVVDRSSVGISSTVLSLLNCYSMVKCVEDKSKQPSINLLSFNEKIYKNENSKINKTTCENVCTRLISDFFLFLFFMHHCYTLSVLFKNIQKNITLNHNWITRKLTVTYTQR